MRRIETITPRKVEKVKKMLSYGSLRRVSTVSGVSYYTVWCISKGLYDQPGPLQIKKTEERNKFSWSKYPNGVL